jgi:acyl-CoA synthetase (AMP-forming)/AMP-acid ligase II
MVTREQTQAKMDLVAAGAMKHTPEQSYTIVDRLEEWAAQAPERPFLIWNGRTFSYGAVNTQANRYAHFALGCGLQPGEVVALLMENRPQYLFVWFALAKIGCVSALINNQISGDALRHALVTTASQRLFIGSECLDRLEHTPEIPERFPGYVVPDDGEPGVIPSTWLRLDEQLASLPGTNPDAALRRDVIGRSTLCLVFTSGTTGLPKLVEWPLAPRVCTSKGRIDLWALTKDDVTMAIAPHAGGAAGTLTYFAAPLCGAKTVMLEDFNPEVALQTMAREKVTAIGVVPTHLVRMLEKNVEAYDLSSLRFIRSAGGYLSPQLAREAEARFGAVITSDLGTQDKGSVSGCRVSDPGELRRLTVGQMLPGNEVRLLGEDGQIVPPNEPGVLWFRGPHSPAGYYRDPVMTAEVFDADGWCTTEDVVKFDQGCLWILGRQKDVIIRGGQNIYPAEVEGLMNEHPSVAAVAVVAMPDAEYGERACAFVVLRQGQSLALEALKDFLSSKKVAKFKWPERLECIDVMPTVGDSGKVDKKALRTQLTATAQIA